MDAPIDDLSLLSEDFANNAIPRNKNSEQSETTEYLVEGVWVPQNVFLAWAEEQEEWPMNVTERKNLTLQEVFELYPNLNEKQRQDLIQGLHSGYNRLVNRTYESLEDFQQNGPTIKEMNEFAAKKDLQQKLDILKNLTQNAPSFTEQDVKTLEAMGLFFNENDLLPRAGSPPESLNSSENSTTKEDPTPKSPDNG